jgi:hypothetical protein
MLHVIWSNDNDWSRLMKKGEGIFINGKYYVPREKPPVLKRFMRWLKRGVT